jgi:hypothetical protein
MNSTTNSELITNIRKEPHMATPTNAQNDSHQADANVPKTKIIRKVSTRAFGKIENNFTNLTAKLMAVESDIRRLGTEIETREKVIAVNQKSGEKSSVRLSNYEVSLRRKQLAEQQTERKVLKGKVDSIGGNLITASGRSEAAAKQRSKNITIKVRLSKEAVKEIDKIKDVVNTFVESLRKTNDVRISTLQALATTNGKKFYADAQKLLRNADFQKNIKAMIAASSPVRTELSNMVREQFGWKRKVK